MCIRDRSIDLTGPHPRSKRSNVFICTVVDVFSKWLEIFAFRNKEALTVARVVESVREAYDVVILLLTVTSGTMTCRLNRSRLKLGSLCTISTLGAFRGDPKNGLENTQVHLWYKRCCHP